MIINVEVIESDFCLHPVYVYLCLTHDVIVSALDFVHFGFTVLFIYFCFETNNM